ncbi:MAG: GtrA family protein [Bacteroidota bacterium]|nr:GtrA family protein [Bacteroidota bacterium]
MSEFFTQQFLYKFIRFALVGVSGTLLDFGITWFSKEKLSAPKYVANAVGFTIAASSNYMLNRWWTFSSNNPHYMVEFAMFFVVAIIGLVLNTIVLYILHHNMKQNFYIAKLLATGAVLFWNFIANYYFTFHAR